MKKIILLLSSFLAMYAIDFFPNVKSIFFSPNLGIHPPSSLNNIDSANAIKMIEKFKVLHAQDKQPQVVSFWLPKTMLHNIVTLLNQEKAGKSGMGTTDGMRIYFAYNTNTTSSTKKFLTKIILVSTRENGPWGNSKRHLDYYSHNSSVALFSMSRFESSKLGNTTTQVPGALLFENCTICPDTTLCAHSDHSIDQKKAESMVHNFYQHSHSITTLAEWFDLGLLNYLDNDLSSSGIRIYLGSSNSSSDWNNTFSISDRFIITSTLLNSSSGIHIDNFNCSPSTSSLSRSLAAGGNGSSGNPPQDEGELCPQNCN